MFDLAHVLRYFGQAEFRGGFALSMSMDAQKQ